MKWKRKCALCLLPFCVGMLMFYMIPFVKVLYYSVVNDQFHKQFVGFANYVDVLRNSYFHLSLKNSLLMIGICVPVMILVSIILAWMMNCSKLCMGLSFCFMLPVVIPTAAVTPIWKELFGNVDSALPVYLLYLYKNIGLDIVLISAGMQSVPQELYEAAQLDGADARRMFRYITLPCTAPSVIFSALLSIVNSFRIYKESRLYYGTNYPPAHSYTLQYYMNNHFLKLDYQALSCSAVCNMLIIFIIAAVMLKLQRKFSS